MFQHLAHLVSHFCSNAIYLGRIGQIAELSRSKSTKPRPTSCCNTLYWPPTVIIPLVPLPVDRVRRGGLLTLYPLHLLRHRAATALVPLRQRRGGGGTVVVDIAFLFMLLLLFEELLLLLLLLLMLIIELLMVLVLLLLLVELVLVVDQVQVVRVEGLDGRGLHVH